MAGEVSIDFDEIREQLKLVDAVTAAGIRKTIRAAATKAGSGMVEKVKSNASFSEKIPPAVYVKTSFAASGAGVTVGVHANRAPNARPIEGTSGASTFRHPLFGKQPWQPQATHPFFIPATTAAAAEFTVAVESGIDDALAEAGFK